MDEIEKGVYQIIYDVMDIKRVFRYFALAAMSFSFFSCVEEDYVPGQPADENCYEVYFPTQSNASDLEFGPKDERTVEFVVKRKKDDGKITVPYEMEGSDVFEASEIVFEDGQTETTFKVSFEEARTAVTYNCSITITDPQYSSVYSKDPAALDFSVTIVEWSQIGVATWRDDLISSFFAAASPYAETTAPIYERSDKPGYYRLDNVYNAEFMSLLMTGSTSSASGFQSYCTDTPIYLDATDPSKVYIVKSGPILKLGSGIGDITIASEVTENGFDSGNGYATLENGVLEFPSGTLMALMTELYDGEWTYANNAGKLRILLPGAVVYDYSVSLVAGLSSQGELPVQFTLGHNITNVKYVICEGRLNEMEITQKSQEIADGEAENVKEVSESSKISVTCPATGVYTLVTANYDPNGGYRGYSSVYFSYLAPGDNSKTVVLDCGVIISNKYASQGLTSENSMEYYVYGEDIENAYVGLFRMSDLELGGLQPEDVWAVMQQNPKEYRLADSQVAEINSSKFTGVVGNLSPGTEYTFIVVASNGYERRIFNNRFSTEGEYSILNDSFSQEQLNPMLIGEYCKEWDFYAVDLLSSSRGRQKIGTLTFSETDFQDGHSEDFKSFLKATGAIGQTPLEFGIADNLIFGYYNGYLYPMLTQYAKTDYYGVEVYPSNVAITSLGYAFPGDALMVGGLLANGGIAFAHYISGLEIYGDFIGWGLALFGDEAIYYQQLKVMTAYSDILLLEPGRVSEPASDSPAASAAPMRELMKEFAVPSNYVETPVGRFKSAVDKMISERRIRNFMEYNDVMTVSGEIANVSFTASPMAAGKVSGHPVFVLR